MGLTECGWVYDYREVLELGDRQRGIDRLILSKKLLKAWLMWAESLPDTDTVVWRPPGRLVSKTRKLIT